MIWSTILLGLGFTTILITWNEVQGKDFLVAVHQKDLKGKVSIYADPGETGGMIQIQYPNYGYKRSWTMRGLQNQYLSLEEKIGTTSGIEYNSILVTCSDHAAKVLVQGNYFNYNVFSPLPLTALGTHYIVSSCDRDGQYSPFIVIATGAEDTDVNITFWGRGSTTFRQQYYRNGDTLSLRLHAYQTFTVESYYDLTGTTVTSTQNIALFIGLMNTTSVVAYDQLLPIKLYNKEYVVAVDNNAALYNLQIISQDNSTLINFNNGTRAVVDGSGFYRRQLQQNEMFHFTTTTPVMTTLCRLNGQKSGFLAVPPVSRFKTQIRVRLPRREITAVVMTSRDTQVNISSSYVSKAWSNIPNSGYKVGIFRLKKYSMVRVSSDIQFTGAVLFYQTYSIFSYGISTEEVAPVYSDSTTELSVHETNSTDTDLDKLEEEKNLHKEEYEDVKGRQLQQDDLYPGHIPTTFFQKTLLAAGSAAMCIYNPARDDMICALGETTGPVALRYIRQKMLEDPVGRQILEEEPLITTQTISISYLESLPDNTFGKAYWRFLDTNGFSPDARRPINFVDDRDLMYVMLRYRQLHDLMHTLLGMPTNMLGEVVVKWFEAIQTGLPMCAMGALVGPVRLGPKHRQKYLNVYLPWVLRSAFNSKFLMSVYFEKHWEQDMKEFRKELNLEPAPVPVIKTGVGALT